MPIQLAKDTRQALGNELANCNSRSLFAARFTDPAAKDTGNSTPRKDWFQKLCGKSASISNRKQTWLPAETAILTGKLQGRLLMNLAGGTMLNANVLLDRYGLPYIPGSAVKGCARRAALAALREWTETSNRPNAPESPLAPCCEGFSSRQEMLKAIARIFGFGQTEWNDGKKNGLWKSDFAWAMEGGLQRPIEFPQDSFGGTVAFLAAYPDSDPGLELDVLTPHHSKYYSGEKDKASDTEEPVPVFFPAVKAGSRFSFPLLPLRKAGPGDVKIARRWLRCGLEVFGLGAKTAAGYGWFDCSPPGEREKAEAVRQEQESLQAAQKKAQESAARQSLLSDFTEATFKNAVLDRLNKPQEYVNLQKEIAKLQKPENAPWVEKLREVLSASKDGRKRLKDKDWFPKEWLPQ